MIVPIDCTYPLGYGPYIRTAPAGHLANLGTIPNPSDMKRKTKIVNNLKKRLQLSYQLVDTIVDLILEMDAEKLIVHLSEIKNSKSEIKL